MEEKNADVAYQVGMLVLVILAVLTLGEYFISTIAVAWWQPLVIIAIIKAWLIIRDYMHIGRLFAEEVEVEEVSE